MKKREQKIDHTGEEDTLLTVEVKCDSLNAVLNERAQLREALTRTQARCTELLEKTRAQRRKLSNYAEADAEATRMFSMEGLGNLPKEEQAAHLKESALTFARYHTQRNVDEKETAIDYLIQSVIEARKQEGSIRVDLWRVRQVCEKQAEVLKKAVEEKWTLQSEVATLKKSKGAQVAASETHGRINLPYHKEVISTVVRHLDGDMSDMEVASELDRLDDQRGDLELSLHAETLVGIARIKAIELNMLRGNMKTLQVRYNEQVEKIHALTKEEEELRQQTLRLGKALEEEGETLSYNKDLYAKTMRSIKERDAHILSLKEEVAGLKENIGAPACSRCGSHRREYDIICMPCHLKAASQVQELKDTKGTLRKMGDGKLESDRLHTQRYLDMEKRAKGAEGALTVLQEYSEKQAKTTHDLGERVEDLEHELSAAQETVCDRDRQLEDVLRVSNGRAMAINHARDAQGRAEENARYAKEEAKKASSEQDNRYRGLADAEMMAREVLERAIQGMKGLRSTIPLWDKEDETS